MIEKGFDNNLSIHWNIFYLEKNKYVKHQATYRFPIVEYFEAKIGKWETRLFFPIGLNFYENSEVSPQDKLCELCRVEVTRMIAHGKEDNSRNLSGYHQPPQSVKRQLQALFCARPDCRHGRNRRHWFCLYSSSAFSCTDTCTTFKGL